MNIEWNGLKSLEPIEAVVARGGTGVENLRIVLAQDFVPYVRNAIGSSSYGGARGTSEVLAKTIQPDGKPYIVINAPLFLATDEETQERTVRHECGHVLAWRRGDGNPDVNPKSEADAAQLLLRQYAKDLVDEFRAEVYAITHGCQPSAEASPEHSMDFLTHLAADIEDLSEDAQRFGGQADPVLGATVLASTCHTLAILAAQKEFDPDSLSAPADRIWTKFFGDIWPELIEHTRSIPDSSIEFEGLVESIISSAAIVKRMVQSLGFQFHTAQTPGGPRPVLILDS
jgi:hypothetical protein